MVLLRQTDFFTALGLFKIGVKPGRKPNWPQPVQDLHTDLLQFVDEKFEEGSMQGTEAVRDQAAVWVEMNRTMRFKA